MHEEQNIEGIGAHHLMSMGSPAKLQAVWAKEICHLIAQLVVGLLFYFFSTTPGYYGDENSCIELRKYAYIYGVGIMVITVIHFLILVISWVKQSPEFLVFSQACLALFYLVFGLVIWIFLWIALSKGEECGSLNTLVWVFTIFMIIGLSCLCCFGCISICFLIANKQQ